MAISKCYRSRNIVVSTYPDQSNIPSIPRFYLICLSPHTLLIYEYPDLLNFSASRILIAVKRETRVLIAGAVVISLLICVLGLRQKSVLGLININAAAKKGWALMKGATRRPPKHSIPHPPERKERRAYVTWFSSAVSGPDKDDFNDGYFVATRILVYQLLHTPKPGPTNP